MGAWGPSPEPKQYFLALCSSNTPTPVTQKHLCWLGYSGMGVSGATPEPKQFFGIVHLRRCFLVRTKKKEVDKKPRGGPETAVKKPAAIPPQGCARARQPPNLPASQPSPSSWWTPPQQVAHVCGGRGGVLSPLGQCRITIWPCRLAGDVSLWYHIA